MTCKIKRRSLRCGGRPKADFGSLFTSVIAPTLSAAGSIVDESIDNNKTTTNDVVNKNTIIPSDPTKTPTMRLGGRKKCWIGAAIGAATSIAGSLFGAGSKKREMRRQKSIQDWQTATQEAAAMSSALNNTQDYQEDYLRQFRTAARLGKTLGAKGIYITDGGDATKIGNNTYLLRGGSHEDVNETGQTGIGINVGGNEVEAEGGEVAQKKNGALRIFSAQPILSNGMSPAQAILRGYNKDKVFNAQQAFKRRNGLKDDGGKAKWGIGWLDSLFGNDNPKKKTVYFYKSQATGKVFKTRQEAIAENNKYKTNLGYRRTINREQEFEAAKNKSGNERIPYIKEKEIKLSKAGKLTGIKLTTNQLDSIAKYANKVGLPIKTALGLVGQESAFGNYFGYANNAKFLNEYHKQGEMNRDIFGIPAYNIVNYERLLPNKIPTLVDDNAINDKYAKRGINKFGYSAVINGDELDKLKVQHEAYPGLAKKRAKFWKDIKVPTLELAFKAYKDHPNLYNAGNPNQQNLVNNKANDVWGSPEIQKWYRTSPYVKHRLGGRCKLRNGGLTSKDRGSSKHPYPSVSSKDFAGGGRSYPIPTKADAVDALRLAGLHGRSDVKAKVYSRYPELRKKAEYGVNIDPYRNYSTTYKNKTSRGNKLSIRNGVVFLNNKRAPKGYKWFDKGNSTTYLVGNDGRFSIYQIHGKKPLERIDFNDDNYVAEANSRLELSNDSPNLPLYKADAQVWKDVLAKDKLERKHIIPNRLPNVRSIKLNTKEIQTNNKGKKFSNFKGVEIPTNLIDSVYKWTKEANQPLVNGFGLLGETNAGNTAPMSEDPNTKGYSNKVVRNNSGRYVSYIRPTELVNHHQFWLGPTSNLINHLIRNGKVKDNIFESGSNAINYLPTDASYIEGDKKTYNEVNNALRYIKKDTGNPNPFINALDYFKTGKYHIDKNYNNKVKERGRDFMTDKNVINRINYLRKRHTLGGRPKAAIGIYVPFNKRYTSIYDAPDYNSDYNGGNVLGNGEVTITAKRIKPTFMKPNNDAMNLIKVPKEEVPYIPQRHNRSRTIFSGGDYLGLGIDTLAALSTGLVNYNTAGKYVLPDRAPIIQASKLPTTYNVNPEIEEVKRYRDRLTGQTFNNTSSSVAALNRSSAINLDALSNLSKLWATKENEENKMLTEDAKNQQTVAAQNVQNELARQSEIARIKNEANQAKGDALNVGLSGLSQAWTNFWTAGRTAYEDDQSRRAMIASSKDATPTRLMEMDFDLSPDILASLYRTAKDDRTKRFYLSKLSPKQRQKYGIN